MWVQSGNGVNLLIRSIKSAITYLVGTRSTSRIELAQHVNTYCCCTAVIAGDANSSYCMYEVRTYCRLSAQIVYSSFMADICLWLQVCLTHRTDHDLHHLEHLHAVAPRPLVVVQDLHTAAVMQYGT